MILLLTLAGCKSKQTVKQFEEQKEIIENISVKDSVKNEKKVTEKEDIKKIQHSDEKKERQTETEIKGKAETNKPLEIFNVENGDTLQAIKITGNAEVHIKMKTSNLKDLKQRYTSETLSEKLYDFSQDIVKEHNLKQRVSKAKNKFQKVNTHTGTFWSFGLIAVLGTVSLIIIGLIMYFKRK